MSSIDQEVPQNTRLLKTIVIVLGILLVVGFIVVIATIIIRLGNLGNETKPIEQVSPALAATPSTYELPLASGEEIKNFTLDGSRMAVHVQGPDQARMFIIDLNSGSIVQSFLITRPDK